MNDANITQKHPMTILADRQAIPTTIPNAADGSIVARIKRIKLIVMIIHREV
jgi:hypothetical protein